jgi:hypothetical protein
MRNTPGFRLMQPGQRAQQRGFSRAIRPNNRRQAARRKPAREVMHRRAAAMADRQVRKGQSGGGHAASAQATPAQSSAESMAERPSRAVMPAESARGFNKAMSIDIT